ncbi:MAG: c-type cytochrome [Cytophagaceae bacterium]
MENIKKTIRAALALTMILLCACSSRRSEPIKGPMAITSEEVLQGRRLFMAHCHKCHPYGEAGLGPAINNNPSPGFVKRFQVRHGLGVMPSFKSDEISKQDLRNITKYLKDLRRHRKCP